MHSTALQKPVRNAGKWDPLSFCTWFLWSQPVNESKATNMSNLWKAQRPWEISHPSPSHYFFRCFMFLRYQVTTKWWAQSTCSAMRSLSTRGKFFSLKFLTRKLKWQQQNICKNVKSGCKQVKKHRDSAWDSVLGTCGHAFHESPGDSWFPVQRHSYSGALKPCKWPTL